MCMGTTLLVIGLISTQTKFCILIQLDRQPLCHVNLQAVTVAALGPRNIS